MMANAEERPAAPAGKRIAGVFYRTVHKDNSATPLSAEGCDWRSGRFHIAGQWRVHYLSSAPGTSWKEITKWAGARLERRAFITYAVEARFRRIADLTDPTTRDQLGVTREMLTGGDVTGCQALARRLREAGFEGLLTPSAADSTGINLVIFEDCMLSGSRFGKPAPIRERKG
jgi:RES domain-containing protein